MSRPNKQKIPTGATPGAGLFPAFAGLEISGLPHGSAETPGAASESKPAVPSKKGRVVLRRETARRGGKSVIVVDGFDASIGDEALETLGKRLRAACGCGGCVKNRTLELQGNQPERIRKWLENEGFRVGGIG